MIKRCNDFGAGGVSVAVGELADGLNINLNAVTKKYDGLDGTELAISESQERMAVVESVCKLVATGAQFKDVYLTFQEYFERLRTEPERWGMPLAALLGAYKAQMELGLVPYGKSSTPMKTAPL